MVNPVINSVGLKQSVEHLSLIKRIGSTKRIFDKNKCVYVSAAKGGAGFITVQADAPCGRP